MKSLPWKIHFGHILCEFELNRVITQLKFTQNLTYQMAFLCDDTNSRAVP